MAAVKKRRRKAAQNNMLVLRLLILVALVIALFEGRLIYIMFTQSASSSAVQTPPSRTAEAVTEKDADAAVSEDTAAETGSAAGFETLAGLSFGEEDASGSGQEGGQSQDASGAAAPAIQPLTSPAVVKQQETSVDDSYFRDAVFIGDSRMEGFRNTSGITQGDFLTSVGMSLSQLSGTKVKSPDGEITVYQGLSGRPYKKIYLMLGTNDLGYYPWEDFKPDAEKAFEQIHELQPDAILYICGVIYVEGSKIPTQYVNNDNVRKVNGYLLESCEELDYCKYLNLNEIFDNGYGSLIEGAASDGVHLDPQYSAMMLEYLKSHYIPVAETPGSEAVETAETANEENKTTETE